MHRLSERIGRLWRARGVAYRPPGDGRDDRVAALEARVHHLEAELEGLQDAVYRQSVLESERIAELRQRLEPERLARDLSDDARRRGL